MPTETLFEASRSDNTVLDQRFLRDHPRNTARSAFGPHCQCGYIIYEAEIDPEKLMIRHCSDCQTLSGSAFRTVV
jgi:hypothetical protein